MGKMIFGKYGKPIARENSNGDWVIFEDLKPKEKKEPIKYERNSHPESLKYAQSELATTIVLGTILSLGFLGLIFGGICLLFCLL